MLSLLKNIFIFFILVATVALGYYVYKDRNEDLVDSSNGQLAEDVTVEASEFLTRLNQLKQIDLDSEILSDPRFTSLTTFSIPPEQEEIGRPNPFEVN